MSTTITGVVVPSSPLPEGTMVEVLVVALKKTGPRGVPAEQVRGLAAGACSPPDDETVNLWIQERRVVLMR